MVNVDSVCAIEPLMPTPTTTLLDVASGQIPIGDDGAATSLTGAAC